ncbi:hypothetical protein [Streptomyces sp. SID10853]|uniref:hypothetical protein n=1 Tax=Streptomyces sp. SID10853 TaxID=2706028 RepID=UPI001940A498|nr:hypothetical protein [Streptomyces sp. SID10853]
MNSPLRARPWEVWAAAWPITAVFTLSNVPTPLLGLWQDRIGFSTGTTTVIFAAYIGGLLLVLPFTGTLADRYGSRRVLLPALPDGCAFPRSRAPTGAASPRASWPTPPA